MKTITTFTFYTEEIRNPTINRLWQDHCFLAEDRTHQLTCARISETNSRGTVNITSSWIGVVSEKRTSSYSWENINTFQTHGYFFGSSSSSCRDENLIQVKVFILVERLTDWFNDLHNVQYCSKVSYHTLARCESRHALWDSCKVHVNSLLMTSSRKISFRILKIT